MALTTGIKLCYPVMLAMLLLVVSSIPVYIAGVSAFFPVVDIMAIYYWSHYRPKVMPSWFLFALGILRDTLEGITIGVSPCVYLLIRFVIVSGRGLNRKAGFLIIWQGFCITALFGIAGKWLLVSFVMSMYFPPYDAIMQFMFSLAMYPMFHWLFHIINTTMPENFQDA